MTIALIDSNNLRNKTIQELKEAIFLNRRQLDKLHSQKASLKKIKDQKVMPSGPIELIYGRIFNDSTQEELDQCSWDEGTVKENLGKLEKEIRMKELATVNDWWLVNEETIKRVIQASDIQNYKNSVFNELIAELENDDAAFLKAADKILLNLALRRSIIG